MRKTTIATLVLGVPTLALTIACGSGSSDSRGPGLGSGGSKADSGSSAAAKSNQHTVVYEVTGAGSADITYGLGGNTSQDNGTKVPWTKTAQSSDSFLIVTLMAQNKGDGEIGCKITIDGKVKAENKSTGQYAIVSCNAS